jgi:carbonic anhydrase/acetyltransferase-like protein (isoleucine patch superfamily)
MSSDIAASSSLSGDSFDSTGSGGSSGPQRYGSTASTQSNGVTTHPNSLWAEAPIISPGAYNASHLNLQRYDSRYDSNANGSNSSGVVSPPGVASPALSSPRTLIHPTLIQKPQSRPLPAFVYVPSNLRYLTVGFFQIFAIWLLYTFTAYQIGVPWQLFLKLRHIDQNSTDTNVDTLQAFLLFLWIMPAYAILFPISLLVTIVVKWTVIGRYQEGRHKLWSFYYFRWWFVQRIIGLVPLVYFRGTILMNWYARAMGMKLGRDVFLNSFNFEAWDLIDIGDEASIGCDAHVASFHVEHGWLIISRVSIGKRAYVGTRSIVQGCMEDDTQLGAMSLLSHGRVIKRNEAWRGSPAKKVGTVENIYARVEEMEFSQSDEAKQTPSYRPVQSDKNSLSHSLLDDKNGSSSSSSVASGDLGRKDMGHARFGRPSTCRLFLLALAQFIFVCGGLSAIILVSATPGLIAIHYIMALPNSDLFPELDKNTVVWQYFAVVPCMAVSFILTFCAQITVYKWLIMHDAKEGHYWVYSGWYLRKWMVDCLLQLSLHTVYTMYATLYLPPWFRTLGMKLGASTEISTAADYCPDMVSIGEGCFVADSVYLGVPTVYMGQVRMAKLTVGSKTFLGNGACLNLDASVGSDALLGVMSAPPGVKQTKEQAKRPVTWPEGRAEIADGTSYLGSPPMLLPRRQQAQGTFDAASTFHPTYWLYAKRLTYEFFRITMPFMFISQLAFAWIEFRRTVLAVLQMSSHLFLSMLLSPCVLSPGACMLMYMGNFEYLLFKYNDSQ